MLKLDNTKLQCFKSCPRQYYWRYVRNLEGKGIVSQALSFGTLVHKFVEDFYQNDNKDRFGASITEIENAVKESTPVDITNEEKAQEGFDFTKTCAQVYKIGYTDHYKDDLNLYEVVGKEKYLEFALTSEFILYGTLDAILKRKSDGKIVLMETKTTGNLGAAYLERLALDTQITTYVYLMLKNGGKPDEILYDVIRKTKMRRRVQDEWQDFGNRLYADMLEDYKAYFYRECLMRDDTALREFESQTCCLVNIIDSAIKSKNIGFFWQNTSSCSNYEGCEYFKLCSFGENNASIFYRERKEVKNES